jgi:putative tryptophan/tyrosine transport system substrate-binding protein
MRRREFIALLGGAAAGWPLAARAQQAATPMIGLLYSASPSGMAFFVTAFRNGLKQSGYIEGQNIAFQYRWGEGQTDRLAALATDLIGRPIAVIATNTRVRGSSASSSLSLISIPPRRWVGRAFITPFGGAAAACALPS